MMLPCFQDFFQTISSLSPSMSNTSSCFSAQTTSCMFYTRQSTLSKEAKVVENRNLCGCVTQQNRENAIFFIIIKKLKMTKTTRS